MAARKKTAAKKAAQGATIKDDGSAGNAGAVSSATEPKATAESAGFEVLQPLRHDGTTYMPGDKVDLEPGSNNTRALQAAGVIAE